MKKLIGILLIVFIHDLYFDKALADDRIKPLVPLPSVEDFTRGNDGWGFGLGMGIEYESAYEGSDEFGFEVDPAGGIQWRSGDDVFFFAGEALGWRGLRSNNWLFEAVLAFDEGREESDSDEGYLNGLGDGDEGSEIVLQARYALDADWRLWLNSRVVLGDSGNLGLFGIGYRFGDKNDGSGSDIAIVAVYHDSEYANKDFGIDAEQSASSGLNQTNLSGGFRSIGINYNYRYYINDNWQIYGEALYEHYVSEIKDSPIARSDYEGEIGIGFIYVF